MSAALHRLLDAVTEHGRHPEDAFLLLAGVLVIFAGAVGWLD